MRKYYLYILITAILFRMIFFFAAKPWNTEYYDAKYNKSDQKGYFVTAKNIYEHNVYSMSDSEPFIPDCFTTPVFPFFLSLLFRLSGGVNFLLPVILNLSLNAISSVLAAYLISLIINVYKFASTNKIALIGGMITALDPIGSYYSVTLMTENLFSLFFIICLILTKLIIDRNKITHYIYLSIISALAILTRPSFSPTLFLIFFALIFFTLKTKTYKNIPRILLSFLILVLLLFPWLLRNKNEFGTYGLSTIGPYSIYISHVFLIESEKTGIKFEEFESNIVAEGHGMKGNMTFQDADYYTSKIIESFMQNPSLFTKIYFRTFLYSFFSPGSQVYASAFGLEIPKVHINDEIAKFGIINVLTRYLSNSGIIVFFWIFTYLFLFVIYTPLFYFLKELRFVKSKIFASFLLINALATMFMNAFVTGAVRYRIPALISMLPLSVLGIAFYMQKRKLKIKEKNQILEK